MTVSEQRVIDVEGVTSGSVVLTRHSLIRA
jgi:hypothetical protein